MEDRNVNNRLTDLDRRKSGMNGGTIAAIVAALLIIGALYTWGPWSTNVTNSAANPVTSTTVGQTSGTPASTAPAPAATTPATSTPANR